MCAKPRGAFQSGRRVRMAVSAILLAACVALPAVQAPAQEIRFFRIGTGDISGTFFAVGSALASAISNPPGSRPCERGGSCGVPNLVAVAQSTGGSIENVRALAAGQLELALVQADVAYWAFHGTGPFAEAGPRGNLRAVANLFPAAVHIVVRQGRGLFRVSDLQGRRVSLGPEGSGTPANALAILAAYGLGEEDITAVYLESGQAADSLTADEIDAFFVVGGIPVNAVDDLARRLPTQLIPVEGSPRDEITSFYPFLAEADIKSGTYDRVAYAPTVAVGTQLLVSAEADEDLIYAVTQALWHERTRMLLESGHPQARRILLEKALERVAIPLHPGAERYYREKGLIH